MGAVVWWQQGGSRELSALWTVGCSSATCPHLAIFRVTWPAGHRHGVHNGAGQAETGTIMEAVMREGGQTHHDALTVSLRLPHITNLYGLAALSAAPAPHKETTHAPAATDKGTL